MSFKLIKILLFLTGFFVFLLIPETNIFAQADPYGTTDLGIQLDPEIEPRRAIVNIINIALSFLGLIAVIIVIYGGFVWMTSGGEAEKVNKAKKILKNGLIGLAIILLSWGIVTWVISQIIGVGDGTGVSTVPTTTQPFDPGWGAIGSCTLESVYPEPGQKEVPRNTSILITFKEALNPASVCVSEEGGSTSCVCGEANCGNWINPNHIEINPSHQEDNLVRAMAQLTEDKKTIIVTPQEWLGSSNSYTDYTITISDFTKESGGQMFATCSSDWFTWTFEVSDKVDLTPPQVISGGIFPPPDNQRDDKETVDWKEASGKIEVNNCLTAYQAAEINSINPIGGSPAVVNSNLDINYDQNYTCLAVIVTSDNNQAQLRDCSSGSLGDSLGLASWSGNQIIFSNFYNLSLEVESREAGNQWNLNVSPQILADTLTIASQVYSFTKDGEGSFEIAVPSACNVNTQAENIYSKISFHPDINVERTGTSLDLKAKVGGTGGNNINLSTTNPSALSITPMSGGLGAGVDYQVNDKPDQPMNTTIQINFNKSMNPITLAGKWDMVQNSIRIIDKNTGQIVEGTYQISNNYRTVEFISDFQCGVNGCGEKIYCLPPNSNLEVQLVAADLKPCTSNNDCIASQPFTICASSSLNYSVCQDNSGNYLPTANIETGFSGIMDTAFNSLDGNRDGQASGPQSFYNQNQVNVNDGDSYKWSFFITDEIFLEPPIINSISPNQGVSVSGINPLEVEFNSLMRNSTLRTGSVTTLGPSGSVEHKRINLFSGAAVVGYWVKSENIDSNASGEPNLTRVIINHSGLSPAVTWRAQVGSGVENIYQNCFKPSAGVGCDATEAQPSCCFGTPTTNLNNQGNCF